MPARHVGRLNASASLLVVLLLGPTGGALAGYQYNPSDFAAQVIGYDAGVGGHVPDWISGDPYTDPTTALGRPTVDTTGDDWYIPLEEPAPVVSVYPAFRYFEIVTVGYGGELTVRFDHKVRDNSWNPYGYDLIVFGNASQLIASGGDWTNRDPHQTIASPGLITEPGKVSVSQDGVNWYGFPDPDTSTTPPLYGADDFATTLGRILDEDDPDESLGGWNLWWGDPTNPTYPLDPGIAPGDLGNKTVAEIAEMYGTSGGGTGFDIGTFDLPLDPQTNMKWIQYVRIEDPDSAVASTEIDAFSDVFARRYGDANLDGYITVGDLGIFAANYGQLQGMGWENGDFNGDGAVNVGDLGMLAANYGMDNGEVGIGGGSPIPEPSAVSLLVLGAFGLRKRDRTR